MWRMSRLKNKNKNKNIYITTKTAATEAEARIIYEQQRKQYALLT